MRKKQEETKFVNLSVKPEKFTIEPTLQKGNQSAINCLSLTSSTLQAKYTFYAANRYICGHAVQITCAACGATL